jgi:hypothetical protein
MGYAIQLKQLDILDNNSDVPIRNTVPIFSRLLTRCLLGIGRNDGTSWLQRELSRRRMRERRTTSSGMTNCLASDSASLVRASAATSSSIEQVVARLRTPGNALEQSCNRGCTFASRPHRSRGRALPVTTSRLGLIFRTHGDRPRELPPRWQMIPWKTE